VIVPPVAEKVVQVVLPARKIISGGRVGMKLMMTMPEPPEPP
jgi:hypothetical protein